MSEMKNCPFCSEEILATAIKCKHCSSLLSSQDVPGQGMAGAETLDSPSPDWASLAGPLPVGTIVENYRVESIVGKGGMGEVYLARHALSHQEVALKVVSPLLMKAEGVAARFLKEAQTMARLRHPNIVQLYNFFEAGGRFFMVMEYLPGRSLKDCLKQGALSVDEAVRVSTGVLAGLHFAHTRDNAVIHRDVKPDNVLLTDSGRVVLIDFGVAKALGTEKLTRTGSTVGTCEYMSPEQVMAEDVGPATDQYAFGVTLFKMLTGSVPFPQDSDSGFEVMRAHLEREPPRLDSLREGLPEWLQLVVSRALSKRSDHRFASAEEMAQALRKGLSSVGGAEEPPPAAVDPLGSTGTAIATPASSPVLAPAPAIAPVRKGFPWWAIVVALSVAIGGVLVWQPWRAAPEREVIASNTPAVHPLPSSAMPARASGTSAIPFLKTTRREADAVPEATVTDVVPAAGPPTDVSEASSLEPETLPPEAPPATVAEELQLPHCREGMCFVPGGEFTMGCSARAGFRCSSQEAPAKVISVPEFWIDRTEVTFARYDACVRAGACPSPRISTGDCLVPSRDRFVKGELPSHFAAPERPVVCVDWHMAAAYCEYAGRSLPTEAQWEKAARGTDGRLFPWGNQAANCSLAIMVDESDQTPLRGRGCRFATTWPTCSKSDGNSPYGLCDLAGNVWEWVVDEWVAEPQGIGADGQAEGVADPLKRTMKGGSWTRKSADLRASFRDWDYATMAGSGVGFRCVTPGVDVP